MALIEANVVEGWIRGYFMFILAGLVALWYLRRKFMESREDADTARIARSAASVPEEERRRAVLEARRRQQEYVAQLSKQDEEVRREKKARELEEKIAKSQAAQAARGTDGTGQRLGDGAADDGEGPMKRLPKLPGGERDTYRPSYQPDSQRRGGRYKPSAPNCKSGG